jgi:outer membrane protein
MSNYLNMINRLIGIIALTYTLSLNGQYEHTEPKTFSLQEALEYAVQNNLNAENARLDITAADRRVWETAASGLPQVDASAVYNNNLSLATTLIPDFLGDPSEKIEVQFGTKHFATAGISASQLLFSGQYFVGLQTAKLFKEFTEKNLQLTEQQVREAITQGYYLVLLGENTLEALNGNYENMKSIYNETKTMFETGFVEENDVDQLEITLTDLENAVLSMERQAVASRSLLKYQMGLPMNQEIVLTDQLNGMVAGLNYQMLMENELDVSSNINYQLLNDQEKLALMDLKLKKTEYMPNLSAFVSLDYTAQRDEFNLFSSEEDWYQASALGFSLNVPIFSSGMRMAGVAQKRIDYEKAKNSKEFAVRGLQVEFVQARYDLANAYDKYDREKRNLELTQKVVTKTEIKYNEGMASSLELTQVNDQYLQTLSSYTSAMVELLNAKTTLDVLLNNL